MDVVEDEAENDKAKKKSSSAAGEEKEARKQQEEREGWQEVRGSPMKVQMRGLKAPMYVHRNRFEQLDVELEPGVWMIQRRFFGVI